MSRMPAQRPGKSKQNYQTPKALLDAIRMRLHINEFAWDLAADKNNTVVPTFFPGQSQLEQKRYYDEVDDSLTQSWNLGGWNWCNPPYADIEPWVAKAANESLNGASTVMLVPASVGANWWKTWVEPYAFQSFLNGRLCFIPNWKDHTKIDKDTGLVVPAFKQRPLYPKDCAILLYTPWNFIGHEIWSWEA